MAALGTLILRYVAGEENELLPAVVGAASILAVTGVYYVLSSKNRMHEFPNLRGIQLHHAWSFYRRRYDFIQSSLERNLGKSFAFNTFYYKIIALTGEDARRAFFSYPDLNIGEGHKILVGAAPLVSAVDTATEEKTEEKTVGNDVSIFNRKINKVLNRSRLREFSMTLLQDTIAKGDKWGNDGEGGRIDPFIEIYDLVLVMTARLMGCHELANNEADVKKIGEFIQAFQACLDPTIALLPWFPSQARKEKKEATTKFFTMLFAYVERRRLTEPTGDAMDVLIADGDTTKQIVGYLMPMFFASVSNTGMIACWTLIHLATHPEWREKCVKEIRDLVTRHYDDSLSSATLYEKLSAIPFSEWEDGLPILDASIRESQRVSSPHISFRRNLGQDVSIDGKVVKRGDFLVYLLSDTHLNHEYYPDPHKYDPNRWLRPDPTPNAAYPFLAWGAGRHPCTGMRTAKLELKLILVMFLMRYEYELVDQNGKFPDLPLVPDRDDTHQARPIGVNCYFNLKVIQ